MEDAALRASLSAILLLSIGWAGYHRGRAHRAGGPVSRAGEGWVIFATLRVSGLIVWVLVLSYLVNPSSVQFAAVAMPVGVRWAGLASVAAGFGWLAWMFRALGLNVTDTVAARTDGTLVTSGPYRFVRHPMYAGLVPIMTGLALVTTNWLVLMFGALAFVTLVRRTRIEEEHLLARYGAAYRQYMETTGRFLPRW